MNGRCIGSRCMDECVIVGCAVECMDEWLSVWMDGGMSGKMSASIIRWIGFIHGRISGGSDG